MDATPRLSRVGGCRGAMGDAAVGGGVHRSAVLDRDSADAARHRAAGADVGASRRVSRPPEAGTRLQTRRLQRRATLAEADHTARFIAGCYAAFPRFDAFTAYSMFYFAAASFSEMQRRLTPERASGGFLRAADDGYSSALA